MKKEDLIKKLKELPDDTEICILDLQRNIDADFGDGSCEGVKHEFEIKMLEPNQVPESDKPFAVLIFDVEKLNGQFKALV